jgi:hypothetical protein
VIRIMSENGTVYCASGTPAFIFEEMCIPSECITKPKTDLNT